MHAFRSMAVIVPAYIVAMAGAETALAFWGALPGTICHAVVMLALANHYIAITQAPADHDADPNAAYWFSDSLPVLMLVPLLRILSLTMPVRYVPEVYWYAMVAIPLLIAAALTVRLLKLSPAVLGFHLRLWSAQAVITLSGVPLSYAAYSLFRPKRLLVDSDWKGIIIGSAILLLFTGFTEELIFRSLFQQVASEIFGRMSIVWSTLLFATTYIGSLSPGYVAFIALVGLFFGWCVYRTGSIWGVVLAHGLLNIGMMIIWPLVR